MKLIQVMKSYFIVFILFSVTLGWSSTNEVVVKNPTEPLPPISVVLDPFEAWPWPWGTECPFPWNIIEGIWKTKSDLFLSYFEFKEIRDIEDGSKYFEVYRYDRNKKLVAKGRGVSQKGRKIVRAAMQSTDPDQPLGAYYIIVRSYTEQDFEECVDGQTGTAITIKPIDSPVFNLNLKIEKIDHHHTKLFGDE